MCGVDAVYCFTDVRSQGLGVLARAAEHYITRPLLDKIFCVPASSAPVECVLSHGGVIMRPHRARLGDRMLPALVYLECNEHGAVQYDAQTGQEVAAATLYNYIVALLSASWSLAASCK